MPLFDSVSAAEERETVELLQNLVRIPTVNPPGGEGPAAELIARVGESWGLETELVTVATGRPNVFVRLRGTGGLKTVLLCGHTDVVPPGETPWDHEPFSGELIDGSVWGRGAVDMKGGVAAMLMAMAVVARRGWRPHGDVLFGGTVGEEADCAGAWHLRSSGVLDNVGQIIIGEPTALDVIPAHRGALWLELTAYGKTAHGSMPHLGVNAILQLGELLRWLVEHRFPFTPHALLAPPTVNVGTIRGGVKTNVVPDRCVATVDLRTVPGQDHGAMVQQVRDIAAEIASTTPGARIEVEVTQDMPPLETPVEDPLIGQTAEAVQRVRGIAPAIRGASYYTDGGVFVGMGIPTVILGPGDDTMCHQPNERVEVAQVLGAVRAFVAVLERLLG